MGFCNNTILFVFLFMLNTSLMNHICICKASHQDLCIPSERQALLNFKHHLVDPSNMLASWSENTNCCNWTSVVCNNVAGHIVQLHISTSPSDDYFEYETYELGGEIDPSILGLNYLSYLDLSSNYFGGIQIPSFLGSMKSLTYLNLSHAGFSGSIPHQIGNLSNLLHLDLGGNHFTGKIPRQIGNLSNLLYLCLDGGYRYDDMDRISLYVENLQWMSSLSSLQYLELGTVNLSNSFEWFHSLQSLPSMTELHLTSCALPHHFPPAISINFSSLSILSLSCNFYDYSSYSIPKWISQLKNLVSLQLIDNLQGSIPNGIQNLILLEDLDLSYNSFNSSIPDWLYNLTHLKSLSLSGNNLQGPISHAIGNLTSLVTLDLGHNYQLEGPIPSSLSSLCNLRRVDFTSIKLNQQVSEIIEIISNCASHTLQALSISGAQLSGHLTPQIGIFKNLMSLDFSGNSIHGAIPISLGNLSSLNHLDLSGNSIHGAIPISLGNLSSLNHLDLSWNFIHGAIPISLGNISSLNHLDLSWNFIHGVIPISLGNLSSLNHLDLSWNFIHGAIPISLGHLSSLNYLSLFSNSIDSVIPISLRNLSSLNDLDLSWNQFNRNPFDAIQSLSALQSLDISDNLFQGEVTEDHLVNFTKLYSLKASRNKLILKVGPNWNPPFQKLEALDMESWKLGPHFPSWMKSLKRLQHLYIPNTNISDSLPTWVWDAFPDADTIDFSNNNIHGNLSDTIKNPINVSSAIYLSSNHLSGPLPHISPNVALLDLSNNSFSGSLDSFLYQGKVTPMGLTYLNLESNNLSGKIPDCWIMWPNLVFVKFGNNNLSGNLPQSLGSLPWLRLLQLRNNALSGTFPICLKNITGLVFLDLSENQFLGIIPLWVGYNLLNLKVFLLRSNKFSGGIPNRICCLNSLQMLDLAENNLTGQIPKCISNLTAMLIMNTNLESDILAQGNGTEYSITDVVLALKGRLDDYNFVGLIVSIDLADNKLSGEIPSQITSLAGLQFLNLSNNLLHGKIPQSIGNMGSLQSIDFSENELSGEIPPSISKLNFLNKLNLSHNNLTGKIPTGTQLQSFEADSFVGNDLCGPPLPNNCNDPNHVPEHEHNAKESKGGINWFYVSMPLGFVSGFWAVVGPLLYNRSWRFTYFWFLDCMWYKIQSFWC